MSQIPMLRLGSWIQACSLGRMGPRAEAKVLFAPAWALGSGGSGRGWWQMHSGRGCWENCSGRMLGEEAGAARSAWMSAALWCPQAQSTPSSCFSRPSLGSPSLSPKVLHFIGHESATCDVMCGTPGMSQKCLGK